MPDFSTESVHAFWHHYDKRTLYRILTSMERLETWTCDTEPTVDEAFNELGQVLDTVKNFALQDEGTIIRILASTHSARALRFMQYLDTLKPGTASKLLMYAEEKTKDQHLKDPYCEMFLKRNLVFERMQLLSRVFAPERVNLVLKALETLNE